MAFDSVKIVGPPRPPEKLAVLQQAIGKTIDRVDFGEERSSKQLHQSETIILHFTDGSSVAIQVGSNAQNLVGKRIARQDEIHTDLMPFWSK